MFTTKPTLPTDRLGPFSLRRLVPLATFCRRDEDFAPFGNFGILAPADSANFPFYFKISSDHSCGKIQMTEKKSIKNYQARIPKIWMQVDSKIQKAGVKYSNDKSFRAPHQRSARILDPGNSRREWASFFLARPREMIFWSLDLVSKHESNKMVSCSRLKIREHCC